MNTAWVEITAEAREELGALHSRSGLLAEAKPEREKAAEGHRRGRAEAAD
ncbi:MAG: hypothetical protein ACK47B_13450 [Armatimonadota bacterium]